MSKKKTNEEFLKEVQDIFGEDIEILSEYKKATDKVECFCNKCNTYFEKTPNALLSKKQGCPVCANKQRHEKHKISLNDYENELHKTRPTLYVEGDYNGVKNSVKLRCKACNNIWELSGAWNAYDYTGNKTGCPFCDGEKIIKGFNTLGDLRPDLVPLFIDKEEPFTVSLYSHKKVKLQCPDCLTEREMEVASLTNHGMTCQVCGSKVSIPNRFIRRILLDIKGQLDFCAFEFGRDSILSGQAADAYIEVGENKIVIEMQGRQHFEKTKSIYKNDFEKTKEYDEMKRQKLKEIGVKEIEIECIKTSLKYMQKRIEESELNNLLDLSKVNWIQVFEDTYKSDIKIACELYKQRMYIYKIAEEIGFSRNTITRYLQLGKELGWCNYKERKTYNGSRKACGVEVLNDNKEVIYTFDSYNKAAIYLSSEEVGYNGYYVGKHAKNGKKYHEYYFRQVQE